MPPFLVAGLDHALHGQDPLVLVFLLLAAVLAGLARGFSGFGGALIFVPLASTIVGPKMAGPILFVVDIFAGAPLIPPAFRQADKRIVGIMSIGAFLAVPLGASALLYLDPQTTRWGIALTAFGFLFLLASGWRYRNAPTVLITAFAGALSGFFGGAAQLGGPPAVTYWLGRQIPVAKVRANLVAFFAVTSLFTAFSYVYASLLSIDVLVLAIMTGPGYGLGLYFGARAFGFAKEETFRRICFVLIGLAAVVSMPVWDGILKR